MYAIMAMRWSILVLSCRCVLWMDRVLVRLRFTSLMILQCSSRTSVTWDLDTNVHLCRMALGSQNSSPRTNRQLLVKYYVKGSRIRDPKILGDQMGILHLRAWVITSLLHQSTSVYLLVGMVGLVEVPITGVCIHRHNAESTWNTRSLRMRIYSIFSRPMLKAWLSSGLPWSGSRTSTPFGVQKFLRIEVDNWTYKKLHQL